MDDLEVAAIEDQWAADEIALEQVDQKEYLRQLFPERQVPDTDCQCVDCYWQRVRAQDGADGRFKHIDAYWDAVGKRLDEIGLGDPPKKRRA